MTPPVTTRKAQVPPKRKSVGKAQWNELVIINLTTLVKTKLAFEKETFRFVPGFFIFLSCFYYVH